MNTALTKRQEAAVRSLDRALRVARNAHLVLCGMDDRLIAYNGRAFDRLDRDLASSYEVQQALSEDSVDLAAQDVYRDSGGW